MQKKILITPCIFLLFILSNFLAVNLSAQNMPKTCRVYCPDGTSHLVDCNTNIDPCTGGDLVLNRQSQGKQITSPLSSGILGAIFGGLIGSLSNANGKNQWDMGAAGGYFLLSGLTYIGEPKARPLGVNIVYSALTFAAGGYATKKLIELNKKEIAPATPDKKDNTAVITAASAVVGGLIGIKLPRKSTKGGYTYLNRKSNIFSKMVFNMSGNSIGLIVKL